MRLSQIMRMEGIEPTSVSIICHVPKEAIHQRLLPRFAAERSDLFDAYQSIHRLPAGRTLRNRALAMSFVPAAGGRLVFAGFFAVAGGTPVTLAEMETDPAYREMSRLLLGGGPDEEDEFTGVRREGGWLRVTLSERPELATLKGRLLIPRPGSRAFVRHAETFDPEIVAVTEESSFSAEPPGWRSFILSGGEVRLLSPSWAARLAEWRGIYLIVDEADGARYVGSAYGAENLLGRWRAHVAGEKGVTVELRHRDSRRFRFSILERVSPDMPADDVIRLEQTWMERLHTRRFGLNAGGAALAERIVNG